MGHQVVSCPACDSWVMEGHNDWECDCGNVMSEATNYVWKNPDGLTLKERYKKQYEESPEYKLLTDDNFNYYLNYVKDCQKEKTMPDSFKDYIKYLTFF